MKQLFNLIRQHRFYTAICVIGTAVTVAFVMVVVMVYDFRTANVAPETRRSRTMYHDGTLLMRNDGTSRMGYQGLGPMAFHALYDSLPGVDRLTWHGGLWKAVCALPASSDRRSVFLRPVAADWFDYFRYDFVAGRPFTRAEYDAARAAFEVAGDEFRSFRNRDDGVLRRFVVISESLARQLFGSADRAVGSDFLMNFQPVRAVGVVRDVSPIFQTAYADVWEPFPLTNEDGAYLNIGIGGLGGYHYPVFSLAPGAQPAIIRAEVERRVEQLNSQGLEFVLKDPRLYTHIQYTFFRDADIDARLVYALLLLILFVVPAVGISGLVHAQMQSRLPEIAIRKAYGASNTDIIGRLFGESLLTTLLGGLLGYVLSCLLVVAGSLWLFGTGGIGEGHILVGIDLLLRPWMFLSMLAACLVFNALSTLVPACMAVRRSISYTLVGGE